jgi:cardiolipin synthase
LPRDINTPAGLDRDAGVVSLPNIITFTRLCCVPLAIWLVLREQFAVAFCLFMAAGASDAVDGWLARRLGVSRVGTVLDPIADKTLLVGMYVTLASVRALPDWLAILVVFRDLLIVGGVMVLGVLGQKVVIRPLLVSKLNTVLQLALVALALLGAAWPWVAPRALAALLRLAVWVVAASTLVSGAAYVWRAATEARSGPT